MWIPSSTTLYVAVSFFYSCAIGASSFGELESVKEIKGAKCQLNAIGEFFNCSLQYSRSGTIDVLSENGDLVCRIWNPACTIDKQSSIDGNNSQISDLDVPGVSLAVRSDNCKQFLICITHAVI